MILRDVDWHPGIEGCLDLDVEDVEAAAEELTEFHKQFHDSFRRVEQQRLGLGYLQGLLSNCERKFAEPMALNLLGKQEVRSLRRFMQIYRWDQEQMDRTNIALPAEKNCSGNFLCFASIHSDEKVFLQKPEVGLPPYSGPGRRDRKSTRLNSSHDS